MSRNVLYIVIAVLVVAVAVLGYQYYRAQQQPSGIKIEMNKDGLSVQTN